MNWCLIEVLALQNGGIQGQNYPWLTIHRPFNTMTVLVGVLKGKATAGLSLSVLL